MTDIQQEALSLVASPYTGLSNLELSDTQLAKSANHFRVLSHERRMVTVRADEAARTLHREILAAHDAGASTSDIASLVGVTEEAADMWIGALVRGRANHGEIPAATHNAERFTREAA